MQCTGTDTSQAETISDLVEQSVSKDFGSEWLNIVSDSGVMCGSNPELMTFRARLIAMGHRNTSSILSSLYEWIQDSNVLNVNGALLQLNKTCNISISSFGDDLCDSYPEIHEQQIQSLCVSNLVGATVGGVGAILILIIIVTVTVSYLCMKRLTFRK